MVLRAVCRLRFQTFRARISSFSADSRHMELAARARTSVSMSAGLESGHDRPFIGSTLSGMRVDRGTHDHPTCPRPPFPHFLKIGTPTALCFVRSALFWLTKIERDH